MNKYLLPAGIVIIILLLAFLVFRCCKVGQMGSHHAYTRGGCCGCCGGGSVGSGSNYGGGQSQAGPGKFGGNPGTIITTIGGNVINPLQPGTAAVNINIDPRITGGTSLPVTIAFTSNVTSPPPALLLRKPGSPDPPIFIMAGPTGWTIQPITGNSPVTYTLEWGAPPAANAQPPDNVTPVSLLTTQSGQQYAGTFLFGGNAGTLLINQ